MKLFTRYSFLTIPASVFIFLLGSVVSYTVMRYVLIRQTDLNMQMEREEVMREVQEDNKLPEETYYRQQWVTFSETAEPAKTVFVSTEEPKMESKEGEQIKVRQLRFPLTVEGKNYQGIIHVPLKQTEYLLNVIIAVTVIMIALILLITYAINRLVVKRLWKPFYQTIGRTGEYNLSGQEPLVLGKTDIEEFTLLNQSLEEMAEKGRQEFASLKEFTANAAHEMQTPLSVIRLKLDALIQDENSLMNNSGPILELENAVSRLSRLHRSLLLLTKVENRQFGIGEEVKIDLVILEKCLELSELMEMMDITLYKSIVPVTVPFHSHLAEIMIGNLVGNAIHYNHTGGVININLTPKGITFSNTSNRKALDPDKVFQRFYRQEGGDGDGNGLGLSIVKQICDIAGFGIKYSHDGHLHFFSITFQKPNQ